MDFSIKKRPPPKGAAFLYNKFQGVTLFFYVTATALGRSVLAFETGFMTAFAVLMSYFLELALSGMAAQTFCFLTGNIGTLFAISSFGVMTLVTFHHVLMGLVGEGGRFLSSFGLHHQICRSGITGNANTSSNAEHKSQGSNTKYDLLSHFFTPLN
jgi:hypothetical protein